MKSFKKSVSIVLVMAVGFLFLGTITGCDPDGPDNCNQNLPVSDSTVMVGDSIIAMARPECENITTELGLITGEKYPDYATSGSKMTGSNYYGAIASIPSQWDEATGDLSAIDTVITDGGGNDILDDCGYWEMPLCESVIDAVVSDYSDLVARMKTDGVSNIAYVGLYEMPGTMAQYNEAINLAMDTASALCDQIDVVFVESRPDFVGHPEYIKADDTHPTQAGSQVLSGLIYDAFAAEGVL